MSQITTIDLLQILFVYLKLTRQIDWAWRWVLFPMWCWLAIVVIKAIVTAIKEAD